MSISRFVIIALFLIFQGAFAAEEPEPSNDSSTHAPDGGGEPTSTPEPTVGEKGDFPTLKQLEDPETLAAAIENTEGGAQRLLDRLKLQAGLGGEPLSPALLSSLQTAINQETAEGLINESDSLKDLPEEERDALAESLAQLLAEGEDVDPDAAIEALYGAIKDNPTTNVAELINGLPLDEQRRNDLIGRLGDRVAQELDLPSYPSDTTERGTGAQYDRDLVGQQIRAIARDSVVAEFSPLKSSAEAARASVQSRLDTLALETSSAGIRAAREDLQGGSPGLTESLKSSEALAERFEGWNIRWDTSRDPRQFTQAVDNLLTNAPSREEQDTAWGEVVRSGGLENASKVADSVERGGNATLEDIPVSFREFKRNAVSEFDETLGLKNSPSGKPFSEAEKVDTALALRDLRSGKEETVNRGAESLVRNVGLGNARDTLDGVSGSEEFKAPEIVSAVRGAFARKAFAEDGAVNTSPLRVGVQTESPLTAEQTLSHADTLVDQLRTNRPEIFNGFKNGKELVAALGDQITSDGVGKVRASFDAAQLNPLQLTDRFLAQHGQESSDDTLAVASRFGRQRDRIDQTFGRLPINDDEEGLLRIYSGALRDSTDARQVARRGLQLFNALPGSQRAQAAANLRAIATDPKVSAEDQALFGTLARVFESRLGSSGPANRGAPTAFEKQVLELAQGEELVRENKRILGLDQVRNRIMSGDRLSDADQAVIDQHGGKDRLNNWYFRNSPNVLNASNQNLSLRVSVSRIAKNSVDIGGRVIGPGQSATVEVGANQFSNFRTSVLGLPSRVSVSGIERRERLTDLSEEKTKPTDIIQFIDGKFTPAPKLSDEPPKKSTPRRRIPRGPVMYASTTEESSTQVVSFAGIVPQILMNVFPSNRSQTRAFGRKHEKPATTEARDDRDLLSVVRRSYEDGIH